MCSLCRRQAQHDNPGNLPFLPEYYFSEIPVFGQNRSLFVEGEIQHVIVGKSGAVLGDVDQVEARLPEQSHECRGYILIRQQPHACLPKCDFVVGQIICRKALRGMDVF